MRVKFFLGGLHSLDELEDEVNRYVEREGIDPGDIVGFRTVVPDTGEIAIIMLHEP